MRQRHVPGNVGPAGGHTRDMKKPAGALVGRLRSVAAGNPVRT